MYLKSTTVLCTQFFLHKMHCLDVSEDFSEVDHGWDLSNEGISEWDCLGANQQVLLVDLGVY